MKSQNYENKYLYII